jgi:hypothetical protein
MPLERRTDKAYPEIMATTGRRGLRDREEGRGMKKYSNTIQDQNRRHHERQAEDEGDGRERKQEQNESHNEEE